QTRQNEFWIGTIEQGIFCLNSEGKLIRRIGFREGLSSMSICSLLADRTGIIWASTPNKLYRIDPLSIHSLQSYTTENGLEESNFNNRSAAMDQYGNLYFGTKNGLVYFNPEQAALSLPQHVHVTAPHILLKPGLS